MPSHPVGYAAAVRTVAAKMWHRIWSLPVFTLNGYVAFNVPRVVTGIGASLLMGIVALHVYLLATQPDLPAYFVVYFGALTLGCLVAAAAMALGRNVAAAQRGWYLGSVVCAAFLALYLVSRFAGPSALVALTGRWDVAPGSLALASAVGFLAVHITVLSGINVAYPQRQGWHD